MDPVNNTLVPVGSIRLSLVLLGAMNVLMVYGSQHPVA